MSPFRLFLFFQKYCRPAEASHADTPHRLPGRSGSDSSYPYINEKTTRSKGWFSRMISGSVPRHFSPAPGFITGIRPYGL